MAKLTKGNKETLEILAEKLSPDLMKQLTDAILEAKASATSKDRKPREVSFAFTPQDAQIFRMRVIEGKSQPDIETEMDLETSAVNAALRGTAWKLANIWVTPEVVEVDGEEDVVYPAHISHAYLEETLMKYGTATPRKPKDKTVKETSNTPAATSADFTSATPEEIAAALAAD